MPDIYSRLLLSTGGGIISEQQQAVQEPNIASVMIGLGGTGISAIRTLKTQVYERLRPDDPQALVPTYDHIVFLGIDTDKRSSGIVETNAGRQDKSQDDVSIFPLDETEFFDIGNKDIAGIICNPDIRSRRKELAWINNRIPAPDLTDAGAGGIRQVGRSMLADKSRSFMSKVENALLSAMNGLTGPKVYIHIFAGLSGGTGSGCFLDVCYLVRKILDDKNLKATIFGYFYLPDVNLSKIPTTKPHVRDYVPINGYAAMQELDYCMQIPGNGGSFRQYYKDFGDVEWNRPPVDMCHLICATNENGDVIPNAYDYAMNVTAEYVMDFLTMADDEEQFGLTSQLSNFRTMVIQGNTRKQIASALDYCVIGASCSYVPMREINTYLAARVFGLFAARLSNNIPNELDCRRLSAISLTRNFNMTTEDQMFNALWREMTKGAPNDFNRFPGDYKGVRDMGNAAIVTHYTNQKAAKTGTVQTNCKSMREGNAESLVNRFRVNLEEVLKDISRGPGFAYAMLAASTSHNIFNIIDGIIEVNRSRWNQEAYQEDLRVGEYDAAWETFRRHSNRRNFEIYEGKLIARMNHDYDMSNYEQMNNLLLKLKQQLQALADNYYLKLARVMNTLIRTFAENQQTLSSEKHTLRVKTGFAEPMMTISELSGTLDEQIRSLNIPNALNAFVTALISNEEVWIQENERNISRFVRNFFVKNLFSGFAGHTITEFLIDKYGLDPHDGNVYEQLTEKVYNDYIDPLTKKAKPLFYFNSKIWGSDKIDSLAYVSVPSIATPIVSAAAKKEKNDPTWKVKKSALTDRIFVMYSACVLPFSAYNNAAIYERSFNETGTKIGVHYYEGLGVVGNEFNDWSKLPSLIPYSYMDSDEEIDGLYKKANEYGVLDSEMHICSPKASDLAELNQLIANAETMLSGSISPDKADECRALADKLMNYKFSGMEPTGEFFRNDGTNEAERREDIRKEHFYLEPSHRITVAGVVEKMDATVVRAKEIGEKLKKMVSSMLSSANDFANYSEALFAGVFEITGRNIVYKHDDFGMEEEYILSKPDVSFPFAAIPVYQSYLTYKALSEELKNEIREKTDANIDTDPEALQKGINTVKTMLDGAKLNAYKAAASRYEQKKEIEKFLIDLNKKFRNEFLLLYGN